MSNKSQISWNDDVVIQLREAAKFAIVNGWARLLLNAADEIDNLRNIIKEKEKINEPIEKEV